MAYQNVGTPRFYVNVIEWLSSNGIGDVGSIFRTLPVNPTIIETTPIDLPFEQNSLWLTDQSFIAVLGHTYGAIAGSYFRLGNMDDYTEIVNADISNYAPHPTYNGFSIATFPYNNSNLSFINESDNSSVGIGSVVIGTYYDMPNAPNLSLTMSREYGGTKEFTIYNGSSMSNTMWSKPPKWGDLGAWELGSGNPSFAKSGRRTWDLKFSFMDDRDLWGVTQSIGIYTGLGLDELLNAGYAIAETRDDGTFEDESTLLQHNNFFSQVWHKTLGGTLPFIFQPDGDGNTPGSGNNNPDQFAICKFKDNSLKATQSAFNVYDISVSIEEVW